MISVIIPVYNKAPFLRRCLDSLVNQSDKSAQVIIVDDGSTDGSSAICDESKKSWYFKKIEAHKNSTLFRRFGFNRVPNGQHDIVYFLKNTTANEELRYSLRSVEENWEYNRVVFYGGCPKGIKPDVHVRVSQTERSKWERVRGMMLAACQNDDLTENFWLFNDDFFIMQPMPETMPPQYNGTLEAQIERVEDRHNGERTDYTSRLRHLVTTLKDAKKGTINYSVHKPMLINRKKMLEVLEKFPDEPMQRALYGNYWEVGGVNHSDMKVMLENYNVDKVKNWPFLSTSDDSFKNGTIGEYIRDRFKTKSRFEE